MKEFSVVIYQLTRPFAYLLIKHEDKYIYDWLIPGVGLVLLFLLVHFLGLNLFQVFSLMESLSGFVSSLPGFFIAALAAVSTFNRADIDRFVEGAETPKIRSLVGDRKIPIRLTKRRFLCLLFSYLSALSIVISIIGILPSSVSFFDANDVAKSFWGSILFSCFYFMMIMQLLSTTLYGLYYLGDRMHH
ncbi:hypothetical protein [Salinicola aestuarinus]|uniref:hypothetical protein n=1 Tax=Salinicola aestuarinus TaxID=1949082 RepID=UPI001300317B|nr:hypothetical protein [Salinicola aestuarinus]